MLSLMPLIPWLIRNAFETGVMVVRVITIADLPEGPAAYDPARAAIPRARRGNGVFVVIAAWTPRKQSFAIAEYDAVLLVRERTARFDQPQRRYRLPGQLRDMDGRQAILSSPADHGRLLCPHLLNRFGRVTRRLSAALRFLLAASTQNDAHAKDAGKNPRAFHETIVPALNRNPTTIKGVRVSLMAERINVRPEIGIFFSKDPRRAARRREPMPP